MLVVVSSLLVTMIALISFGAKDVSESVSEGNETDGRWQVSMSQVWKIH